MQQSNLNIYVDYFRRLAMAHTDLQHNPVSEIMDSATPEMAFFRWDALEVVAAMRTKIKWPCMVLDIYENNLDAASEYDIRQRPIGNFTVLDNVDPNKPGDQERAYSFTEKIVMELLQQIWADHYAPGKHGCSSPFKDFIFKEVTITKTGRIFGNEYGWLVEFPFEFQKKFNIAKAPETGIFDTTYILGFQDEWLGMGSALLGWQP